MSGGSCAWPMRRSSVCIQSYRARHVQVCEAPILAAHGRRAGQIGSISDSSPGAPDPRRAQDGSVLQSSPGATSAVVSRTVLLAEAGLGDHGRRAAQDRFLTDSTSSSARRARRALASLIRPPEGRLLGDGGWVKFKAVCSISTLLPPLLVCSARRLRCRSKNTFRRRVLSP